MGFQGELNVATDIRLTEDDDLIPTGKCRPLKNTSFDFRDSAEIWQRGLDHNFSLASGRRAVTDDS